MDNPSEIFNSFFGIIGMLCIPVCFVMPLVMTGDWIFAFFGGLGAVAVVFTPLAVLMAFGCEIWGLLAAIAGILYTYGLYSFLA